MRAWHELHSDWYPAGSKGSWSRSLHSGVMWSASNLTLRPQRQPRQPSRQTPPDALAATGGYRRSRREGSSSRLLEGLPGRRCSLCPLQPDSARHDLAWFGRAGRGSARQGLERQGKAVTGHLAGRKAGEASHPTNAVRNGRTRWCRCWNRRTPSAAARIAAQAASSLARRRRPPCVPLLTFASTAGSDTMRASLYCSNS